MNKKSNNPNVHPTLRVGAVVVLQDHAKVHHTCPEGREDNSHAIIRVELTDLGPGAVYLDRDLHGCRYWNTDDLALITGTYDELLPVARANDAMVAFGEDMMLLPCASFTEWNDAQLKEMRDLISDVQELVPGRRRDYFVVGLSSALFPHDYIRSQAYLYAANAHLLKKF